jgi:N-acylneuraminate cytidylyltransferase
MNFKTTLCIIPARGGSKRIPNKNIKKINGYPMIYWPRVILSKLFSSRNVLVSTDSELIKHSVEAKGLSVPFMRPAKLSDDFTGTSEVVAHALSWYEDNIQKVDYVLTVYPTAVLLSEKDIISAMKLLKKDKKTDSVMTATNFPFPIQRAIYTNKEGFAEMLDPTNYLTRSQDLLEANHDAGQFYLSKSETIRSGKSFIDSKVKVHLLHRNNVVDIDTVEDFEIAEQKLVMLKKQMASDDWKFQD